MNRYISRLSLFLLVLLLTLTSCRQEDSGNLPSDPLEAIKEISKAAMEMKSAHYTMDITMDMKVQGSTMTLEMDAQGDVEMKGISPEDANLQMEANVSFLGQDIAMELVAVDGAYWMRQAGQSWEKMPADSINLAGGLGSDPAAALQYLEHAKNVKRLKDEKVDGVDCYRLSFAMDADALGTPEMLGQLTGGGQLTDEQAKEVLKTAELEGKVWAGKADLLPRRQMIALTFKVSGLPGLGDAAVNYDIQMDIRFSKINEPVEIKAPSN